VDHLTKTFELVHRVQSGDKAALNDLFGRYYERLRHSVRIRLDSYMRRQLESGDILQTTFAKAFRKFDQFEMRNEASLIHWLAEIAARQIKDARVKAKAVKRGGGALPVELDAPAGDASGTLAEAVVTADTGPQERSQRREHWRAVEQCMDQLPAHYREVLVLRDYDGLSWREIADRLGKNTESAARELHSRAKVALGRLMLHQGISAEQI
jgi:RNA polymerase sigma-70 factor (ECF subfamily)